MTLPEPRADQGCSPVVPHLEFPLKLVAQSGVHLLAVLLHVSAQGLQRCQVFREFLSPSLKVIGEKNSLQLLASGTGSARPGCQILSQFLSPSL